MGLGKETPMGRQVSNRASPASRLIGLPRVGGLHHRYEWRDVARVLPDALFARDRAVLYVEVAVYCPIGIGALRLVPEYDLVGIAELHALAGIAPFDAKFEFLQEYHPFQELVPFTVRKTKRSHLVSEWGRLFKEMIGANGIGKSAVQDDLGPDAQAFDEVLLGCVRQGMVRGGDFGAVDGDVLQGVASGDFHADEGLFQGDIELDVLYDGGGLAFGELDANGQGGLLVGPDGESIVEAVDVEANGFLTVDFLFAEVLYISVRIVLHSGDNVADEVQDAASTFQACALDVIVACDLRDPKGDECEHSATFKIEDHGRVHVGQGTSGPGVDDLGLVYVGHGSSDPGAYDDVVHFEGVGAFAYDVVEDDSAGVEDWLDDLGEGDCAA